MKEQKPLMGSCISSGEKARKEFRKLVQDELESLSRKVEGALCSCVVNNEGNIIAGCTYMGPGQLDGDDKKHKGHTEKINGIEKSEIDSIMAFKKAALDVMREMGVTTISDDGGQAVTIVCLEGGYTLILHTRNVVTRTDTLKLLSDNAAQRVAQSLSQIFQGQNNSEKW